MAGPREAAVVADNVTDTEEPTPTDSGDAGEVLTPAGNPLIATLTFPVSPWTAATATLRVEVPPCGNETALGLAAREKSPEGAGSLDVAGEWVLVQLATESPAISRKTRQARRFLAVMKKFLLRRREDRAVSAFLFGPMPKTLRAAGDSLGEYVVRDFLRTRREGSR